MAGWRSRFGGAGWRWRGIGRLVPQAGPHRERDAVRRHLDLDGSQSPEGVGRVVAALAADATVMSLTGRVLTVTDLAQRYGVDPTT